MAQTDLNLTRLRAYATVNRGGSVPSTLDQDEIVNLAGRTFFSLHPWNFRYRPPVNLSLTASQSYIELPFDFGEMVAYQTSNTYGLVLTTPQDLADRRSASVVVAQSYYWGTIVQPAQASRTEPPPPPRLEIWPEPSAAAADVVKLWYRAAWVDLVNTDDVADVPRYAHLALIQTVRAVASGMGEELLEPAGGIDGYLENVLGGRVWEAAVTTDGLQQPDYGPITGGAIEIRGSHTSWRSRTASAVSDPA